MLPLCGQKYQQNKRDAGHKKRHDTLLDQTLVGEEDTEPFSFNESNWEKARAAYWYRKFSQETLMGQLMTLRPDKPLASYFQDESLAESAFARGVLLQMRSLLIAVLIVLSLIAVLMMRK